MALVADGGNPTVGDAAAAAGISRRTAYRYFPTQERLLTEAALEALRPQVEQYLTGSNRLVDVEERLDAIVRQMYRLTIANEGLLRTIIRLTIEQRASEPGAQGLRGRRRIAWIETALSSLRTELGKARFSRLVSGISLCVGPEALLVLRDVRDLSDAQAVDVALWATRALLRAARAEAAGREQGAGKTSRPRACRGTT
ncbi:MAG: TetR family transcriptional regulator [Candidatus Eremiobacteraeota bacterium]|nr:TetR family transcriptional regulator [Candidatus Eremiobacteraeota bacterium]